MKKKNKESFAEYQTRIEAMNALDLLVELVRLGVDACAIDTSMVTYVVSTISFLATVLITSVVPGFWSFLITIPVVIFISKCLVCKIVPRIVKNHIGSMEPTIRKLVKLKEGE